VLLDLASVPAKWHLHLSNGLSRVYECDRQMTDRSQMTDRRTTDDRPHYGENG